MHVRSSSSPFPSSSSDTAAPGALDLVLRQARRLHRASRSDRISVALPAVRRVHSAGVVPGASLSALYRSRADLQRKHFLRTLAIEAGFADWERWRPVLATLPPEALDHFRVDEECTGFLNAWFSDEAQAQAFVQAQGGRVIRYGRQAVVMAPDAGVA